VVIDDARQLAAAAAKQWRAQADPSLSTQTIAEFLEFCKSPQFQLTSAQKNVVVSQANLIIQNFYAHLPFKRARYALDPVQSLRLVEAQIETLSNVDFHRGILDIFISLRDAHTFYGLPEPFSTAVAYLPFSLSSYVEGGVRHFAVTSIVPGFDHATFRELVEVTAWNGMPMERAVERAADMAPGPNPAARFKRGLARLTMQSLKHSVAPDEEWVVVEYIPPAEPANKRALLVPWYVMSGTVAPHKTSTCATSTSDSQQMLLHSQALLQGSELPAPVMSYATANAGAPPPGQSLMPDVLEFQRTGGVPGRIDPALLVDAQNPAKRFGYIRIKTFDAGSQQFFREFQRILDTEMERGAPDGLILDVRSNPGGVIEAGERILQLLTPNTIHPAQFHFINSSLIQRVMSNVDALDLAARGEWQPWVGGSAEAVSGGSEITNGRPLTAPELANGTGQRYHGPVTLIIDALAYSATDIFCAGFQDNRVGTVIGVDANTGGGGASRWLHTELMAHVKGTPGLDLDPLPMSASMALASRRSMRVRANAGVALEDAGARCDLLHAVTRNDLLKADCELLAFACSHLGSQPAYQLQIVSAVLSDRGVVTCLATRNLSRVEFFLDGNPQGACSAEENLTFVVSVAGLPGDPQELRVRGYITVPDEDFDRPVLQLVAAATTPVSAANAATATS
jgi:hypothetical protein